LGCHRVSATEKIAFSDHVWAEFEQKGIVVLPGRKDGIGGKLSLTHSTYPGVLYQVTRWEGNTPTGHVDAMDKKTAIDDLWHWVGGDGWREQWAARRRA
jgi:hypothetical protein